MIKSKRSRFIITLECIECRKNLNEIIKKYSGISRYATMKNKKNTTQRLELKKYCSYCIKHTFHKEIK